MGRNRLGVRLRPLDEIDFEERDWVPYSGWPFDKSHLDPFYERAQTILQIGPYTYDVDDWEDPETSRLPFANGRVKTTIFQFGPRAPFIGEYRDEIARANNITTYLYANAVELETNETAQMVTRLRVACLQGKRFWVSAKLFILAANGIEIPRLLLLSNRTQTAGLGNEHDLVGRFFMEHPHHWSGVYVPSDSGIFNATGLYRVHTVNGIPIMGKLTLAEEVLRREELLSYCVSIHPSTRPKWLSRNERTASKGASSIRDLRSAVRRGKIPDDLGGHLGNVVTGIDDVAAAAFGSIRRQLEEASDKRKPPRVEVFTLNHMSEQVPNPNSRVTLAAERDALGCNRAQLDWQLSPLDMRTIIRAQEIISEELRRAGLGRLVIELKDETPPPDLHGGVHQMGTTRMHSDPKQGVVDEHCRVHGLSNLYIASSSVFPTVGYANPVLTMVALTVRLADHVKELVCREYG
jgi:choline dehydrogenase-like flavoprotein